MIKKAKKLQYDVFFVLIFFFVKKHTHNILDFLLLLLFSYIILVFLKN